MDFELTSEQRMLQATVREFADKRVAPVAAELDRNHRFPAEIIREMAGMGLLGMTIPETYGGAGMDTVCYALAMEEIARACASTAVIMSVNNSLCCDALMKWGTEDQKQTWLVPLARGDKLGCYALSEPGTGSDAAAQTTTAVRRGDRWIVNGTKNFITNGREADVCLLYAMHDRSLGSRGIVCFIVDMKRPGVRVGKVEDKLGITASSTVSLVFEDYEARGGELLGEVGQGFKVAMSTLDSGRIGIASQALGIARAAFECAVRYAHERHAFGGPIAKLQAIQFKVADMATELDAARLLIHRAARLKDNEIRHTKESSMAKLFASEMAHRVVNHALQIHGGYGYIKDFPVERHYRDQRITEIYEGTSEIQRLVIARAVLDEARARM
jgi:butyryl-CoA dehydrogenase